MLDRRANRRHLCAMIVYKIFRPAEWSALQYHGQTLGAPIDIQDGFVHFSTAAQLRETAAKHFAHQSGLELLACDGAAMGDALRWEPSRGGALFPHLYRALSINDVLWHQILELGSDGHIFPEGLQ